MPTQFRDWQRALAKRGDATFKSYPKLDHLFPEGTGLTPPPDHVRRASSVKSLEEIWFGDFKYRLSTLSSSLDEMGTAFGFVPVIGIVNFFVDMTRH